VSGADIEDLIMGCGQPAGEAGFNVARVVAILAGIPEAPGVTVNRYCSSSLQTIRMAAHAIKAGEGDCFIAAGVEAVSRYGSGASDTAPNAVFKPSGARTVERSQGGASAFPTSSETGDCRWPELQRAYSGVSSPHRPGPRSPL
jgi:acetyl-CoA C-acetyltransferase